MPSEDFVPEYLNRIPTEETFPRDADSEEHLKSLRLRQAGREVDTLLEPADGIFGYYSDAKRFGTRSTVAALHEVARIWALRRTRPRIGVGDISLKGGGDISGHASHETGRDVDLRPIRNDGTEGPLVWQSSRYSYSLTQELIDLLYSNGVVRVKVLGFNDPQTQGTSWWKNHDNHLHVRFFFENQAPGYPLQEIGHNNSPASREIQRRLNNWQEANDRFPNLSVDGDFGQNTHDATLEFQSAHGLEPDGRFGPNSWRESLAYLVPPT